VEESCRENGGRKISSTIGKRRMEEGIGESFDWHASRHAKGSESSPS
jgi:hypothetical protein